MYKYYINALSQQHHSFIIQFGLLLSNQSILSTSNMESKAIEIIKDRLYWLSDTHHPKNLKNSFYFNIDEDLVYQPFYMDFGPLSLGKTWKYITELEKLMESPKYKNNKLYHFTGTNYAKVANAAYLMGAFQVVVLGRNAETAYKPFKNMNFTDFRDASYGECSYKCTILDCLRGLEYAIKLGWFDYKNWNLAEYEHYQKVDNGDLNWIIPKKFIAFSSPSDQSKDAEGYKTFTPNDYLPIFKKFGVSTVVRLSKKTYDASGFTKNGFKHIDMYFTDGTAPSQQIVDAFLELAEKQQNSIAIHCKAGLGRTGTLIGCYAMKHYHFSAADFIGWIRICRPGSILGPQQHFLIQQEKQLKEKGINSPIWNKVMQEFNQEELNKQMKKMSIKQKEIKMQENQKFVKANGDKGQGERLVNSKYKRQNSNNRGYSSVNAKRK